MLDSDLITGISATALGILAVFLAAVEYYVSVEAIGPGSAGGAAGISEVTFGTGAYILGYLVAGVILLTLGVWKIRRSMRGS